MTAVGGRENFAFGSDAVSLLVRPCACAVRGSGALPPSVISTQPPTHQPPRSSPRPQPVDVPFMQFYGASTKQAYDGMVQLDTLAAPGGRGLAGHWCKRGQLRSSLRLSEK